MGVEDILQQHSLLQQDIAVHGDRVKEIDEQSKEFLSPTQEGKAVKHSLLYNSFHMSYSLHAVFTKVFSMGHNGK